MGFTIYRGKAQGKAPQWSNINMKKVFKGFTPV